MNLPLDSFQGCFKLTVHPRGNSMLDARHAASLQVEAKIERALAHFRVPWTPPISVGVSQ